MSLSEDRASFVLFKMLAQLYWALGSRRDSKGPMSLSGDFTFWTKLFDWQGHRLTSKKTPSHDLWLVEMA